MHLNGWKLVVAAGLAALIVASVLAKAPRGERGSSDSRRLVLVSLALYALGTAAWISGHLRVAAVLYGIGIGTAAFGVWLSRVDDGSERRPMTSHGPADLPPDPGGTPPFDWEAFERELVAYTAQQRESTARR
ncbi:MAG TPA: hypothetical protein VIX82_14120 [Solirubrobacteraceae bacterium]